MTIRMQFNIFHRVFKGAALAAALLLLSAGAEAAGRVDVTNYGAVCDGVTNDNTALQNALAAALAAKVALYFPSSKGCVYSTTLTLTKLIPLLGDGPAVSRLIYTGSGNAITIVPPTRPGGGSIAENIGHVISGLRIDPASDGGGQIGVFVYLPSNSVYAYFDISNVQIGPFGVLGLSLDNSVGNTDGIFNGRVSNSLIYNGISGTNIGDSITFDKVTATGKNNVSLSGLIGARQVSYVGGQISTANGALVLSGLHGFRARDIWIEAQGACFSGCTTAAISIVSSWDAVFEGLTFNINSNPSYTTVFALSAAKDTKILNNNFTNRGTNYHVYAVNSTSRTRIEGNNYYAGGDTLSYPPVNYFAPGSN